MSFHRNVRVGFPEGYVEGLPVTFNTISRIDIGPGSCRDTTDKENITKTSTLTADLTVNGVNGLDTGVEQADRWYALFVIDGPSVPVACLASLSGIAPLLPSGHTVHRRVGWVRNGSGSDVLKFEQIILGRTRRYCYNLPINATIVLQLGSAIIFTDVDLSSFVPPTSRIAHLNVAYHPGSKSDLFQLRKNGFTDSGDKHYKPGAKIVDFQRIWVEQELDANQILEYKVDGTNNDLTLRVVGFEEEI